MLLHIADVLSADEARQFREALAGANWQSGSVTAGDMAAGVKRNQQVAPDDPTGVQLGDFILQRLGAVERFMAAAVPLKVLPPRFNRYVDGGTYGDHMDAAIFSVPGTPHRIRGDLSATLFLSDPGSYDGGELLIAGSDAGVKLPAGHMALYTAGTLHRVAPVTRGERLAAFFWVQSLVREEERRAILLQLDDAIRALRMENPDSAAVAPLSWVYHNLLRQWANT